MLYPKFRHLGRVAGLVLATWILHGRAAAGPLGASEAAALAEMQTLSQAEDEVALFTDFYVPLEDLDDIDSPTTPAYDYINNGGGATVIRPERGFFNASRFNFGGVITWDGPFVNFQQGKTQLGTGPYDQGSPLDPWLQPYYFFTPMGLVRGDTGAITQELYGDAFDRYAIVSLGPDGVMSNDDIIFLFGGGVTSLGLSSISGPSVIAQITSTGTTYRTMEGTDITLKGYAFGATQGGSKVFFGGTELPGVTSWSSKQVTVTLPPGLLGTNNVFLMIGAAASNSAQLTINAPPLNAAAGWQLYE